ncbi:MAG: molybdopterin-dependent oxidoreductase [Theionarchaea archaeon]|nr:molybdopterin-dependent oxidoreductase [Theionarchaea archaeon]
MKQLLLFLPVLLMFGCLSQQNSIELDVETLKTLPYTTITTPDPHLEATIEYGGVLLKDILTHYKKEGVIEIKIVAKDGYTAVIKGEDLNLGILIAYMADGSEIPEDTGGPLKAIFSEEAQKVYGPENWVWWVTNLEIS